MANRELLLGDEALALGALHAGLSGVYAYPGTPSTEITEYIQNHPLAAERNVHCKWSANEKTAMEEALGMSFCGKRALVCMKHVGMNVAADAFVNSGMTGANGGLVVVAADDPSMHSSQNEQDSRFYGKFAFIPVFEPSTQQETYDMVRYAFDYSERFHIPVLMRLTTRMAHSRAVVETAPAREPNAYACPAPERMRQWVLMPGNSRVRYNTLLEEYARFEEEAAASRFNTFRDGADRSRGIIACGIAYNYLMENYPDGCPHPCSRSHNTRCRAPKSAGWLRSATRCWSSRRGSRSSRSSSAAFWRPRCPSAAACRVNCPARASSPPTACAAPSDWNPTRPMPPARSSCRVRPPCARAAATATCTRH